ncbi:hypothetical protein BaRGS_00000176, partial [Batillaria attramentaria]
SPVTVSERDDLPDTQCPWQTSDGDTFPTAYNPGPSVTCNYNLSSQNSAAADTAKVTLYCPRDR